MPLIPFRRNQPGNHKDNKYATILSDTEFIKCTLTDRHFCVLNTGLYHIDTGQCCATALFSKDNDNIDSYSRLALFNITGPQANYLDQDLWVILVETPIPMEVKCKDHSHIKTLDPHSLSSTCNQHAVHYLLLLNFHLTSKDILHTSISH